MAAGLQPTLADVNNMVGNSMSALNADLSRVHQLYNWYQTLGAGHLTNAPYSMAAADDANVGSALADAEQLYQLFHNNGTLSVAKDFTAFMARLWGYGLV